jgi:hypothetical protein
MFDKLKKELKSIFDDQPKNTPAPKIVTQPTQSNAIELEVAREWSAGGHKPISITQPERGIFITGSNGSGKTKSLIQPIIWQAIAKDYTGILYDFKNPILSTHTYTAFRSHATDVQDYYINFEQLDRSARINPLNPKFLTRSAYADNYADTVLSNLAQEFIKTPNFFTRSAKSLLSAVIWYLAAEKPRYCTLPHAIRMILSKDLNALIKRVNENDESEARMASIESGLESKNQTAGVISTLQGMLAPLATPEINWVLSGDDLTLDLNNPSEKKFLSVANTPDLAPILSPMISLIFSAALQNMNNLGRHRSMVIIDELPTIYIPNLDTIPATGRENKIAPVLAVQDYAQLEDKYTDKKAEVIASVLNNQIFGKTTNQKTANRVSALFGKEFKSMVSTSRTQADVNLLTAMLTKTGPPSVTKSVHQHEMPKVKPEEVINLKTGEFFGTLVGSWKNEFKMQLREQKYPSTPIPVFNEYATRENVQANSKRIKEEALAIIDGTL